MDTDPKIISPQLDLKSAIRKRAFQVVAQYVVIYVLLFLVAGTVQWPQAWFLLGAQLGILIFNFVYLMPRNPEVIAERSEIKAGTKGWDKLLASLSTLIGLVSLVLYGLDWRFRWSLPLPLAWNLAGLALVVLGHLLFTWAMVSNKYFATVVRIQSERNHSVATAGPYRYVRHPGYVGFNLFTMATPLALGTLWGLIPAGMVAALLVLRTALEDRTLQEELPGYREYTLQVRYRLLPGVW